MQELLIFINQLDLSLFYFYNCFIKDSFQFNYYIYLAFLLRSLYLSQVVNYFIDITTKLFLIRFSQIGNSQILQINLSLFFGSFLKYFEETHFKHIKCSLQQITIGNRSFQLNYQRQIEHQNILFQSIRSLIDFLKTDVCTFCYIFFNNLNPILVIAKFKKLNFGLIQFTILNFKSKEINDKKQQLTDIISKKIIEQMSDQTRKDSIVQVSLKDESLFKSQTILLKQQLLSFKQKYDLLMMRHEQKLQQFVELNQSFQKQKQINNLLMQNLKDKQHQMKSSITLNIQGEFLSKKVIELEEQLIKYRNGVHQSVDRRVKKIVNQYQQDKQVDQLKKKSRISNTKKVNYEGDVNHHNYYNIQYQNFNNQQFDRFNQQNDSQYQDFSYQDQRVNIKTNSTLKVNPIKPKANQTSFTSKKQQCEDCLRYRKVITEQDRYIQDLQWQIQQLKQNKKPKQCASQNQYYENQSVFSRLTALSPINNFKKKLTYPNNQQPYSQQHSSDHLISEQDCEYFNEPSIKRQDQMLREITNLVNGMGKNRSKNHQVNNDKNRHHDNNKSRRQTMTRQQQPKMDRTQGTYQQNMSRLSYQSSQRMDHSVFTIKGGVNRHHGNVNTLF